jgi:hypothetical protein
MMRIVAAAIPLCLLLQVAPGPTATNLSDLPKTTVPAEYFGLNDAGRAYTRPWPTLETGAIRVFDSQWVYVEPQRGQWVFENLDRDVEEAHKHGHDLDLILTATPTWASARPTEGGRTPGARAEAADLKDWEAYVSAVAKRYKGRVHTYELWNEPNLKSSYTGDIPHLVALSKSAYRILKQTDPNVVVISPSLASVNAFAYIRPFLEGGGAGTFDVLGFHFYDNLGNPSIHPENIVGTAAQLRKVLTSVGMASAPIWNTESGYYIASAPQARYHNTHWPAGIHIIGQDTAVQAIGRSYILGWAAGIQRFYWYAWGEPAYALVDDNGTTEKDATQAYRTVRRWLLGKRYLDVSRSASGRWLVHIEDAHHKPAWIIWNETGAETFDIPKEWGVSQSEDLLSRSQPLSSTGIQVTHSPTLLF